MFNKYKKRKKDNYQHWQGCGDIVSFKTEKECKSVLAFWIVNVLKMLLSKHFF